MENICRFNDFDVFAYAEQDYAYVLIFYDKLDIRISVRRHIQNEDAYSNCEVEHMNFHIFYTYKNYYSMPLLLHLQQHQHWHPMPIFVLTNVQVANRVHFLKAINSVVVSS